MAKQVGLIAREFDEETDPIVMAALIQARLFSYANDLDEWANNLADIMLRRAGQADYDVWLRIGKDLSKATRKKLRDAVIGPEFKRLQHEQVTLIKTLPIEASQTVHKWVKDGLSKGMRFPDIAKRIMNDLEPATAARAICIARTESARARTNFTLARAKAVGSTHYIWHTVGDGAVRGEHKALNGTIQDWNKPPVCEYGKGRVPVRAHPGCVWNCFPAETLVRIPSDLIGAIRAPFNGRVVDIGTAFTNVTATPNHPMLTNRGWVPAGEINEGDYLLYPLGDAIGVIEPDEDDGIASIGELFDALKIDVVRPADVHFDFYGDIPDSQVDTAVRKGSLSEDFKSKARKSLLDFEFAKASGVVAGVRHDAIQMSLPSECRESSSLIEGCSAHTEEHSIRGISDLDLCLDKSIPNSLSVDVEGLRKSKFAFPFGVTADDLSNVEFDLVDRGETTATFVARRVHTNGSELLGENVCGTVNLRSRKLNGGAVLYKGFCVKDLIHRDFLGHVYTLITRKGWYGVTPYNLTAKNCRCWAEPIFPKSEYEE